MCSTCSTRSTRQYFVPATKRLSKPLREKYQTIFYTWVSSEGGSRLEPGGQLPPKQGFKVPEWHDYIARNVFAYAHFLCVWHLMVSIVDVVYMFFGMAYLTSCFTCSYDKELLDNPIWSIMERAIRNLNYGSHGFVPFPYIFTFTDRSQRYEKDSYCHPNMLMVPWADLLNFIFNCYWVKLSVTRYKSLMAKDMSTFEMISLVDICKMVVEITDPERIRYDVLAYTEYDIVMKVVHIFILIIFIYVECLLIYEVERERKGKLSKNARLIEDYISEKEDLEFLRQMEDGMLII